MQIGLGLLFLGSFSVTLESDIFIQSMLHPLTTASKKGQEFAETKQHDSACFGICNMKDSEIQRICGWGAYTY